MSRFLTEAWISELDAAARLVRVSSDLRLTLQQVVLDEPNPDIAYVIRIKDGGVAVRRGRDDDADITLTQDRTTAAAVARGELSAQSAFLAGRLRIGGDLRAVINRASELSAIEDVFADARASTTW